MAVKNDYIKVRVTTEQKNYLKILQKRKKLA